MIVDPDFLDHWRTGMVVDALADPMAPTYILRLWAHCQERKSDTFVMPTRGLKAQCKCPGDAAVFEAALIEAGFLERNGDTITVTGWAEKNASLLAAWENGSKGGRPKKNPDETHGKPTGNPAVTHGEPAANPAETDKRREEKNSSSLRSEEVRATRLPQDWALPDEWRDWAASERKDLDPIKTAEQFRDYWAAKPGKDGRKTDWQATWRNWVRNQRTPQPVKTTQAFAPPGQSRADRQLETAALLTGARRPQPKPIEAIDVESRILPA
jgi:hypothetical protein